MRARLTYANVMATVAVFIALGGGAYAAVQINGSQIKKNSIPSNRLKKNQAVPLAENVETLHLSSVRGGGKKGAARVAASGSTSGLVEIPEGQSATILEVPPFTIKASCDDAPGLPPVGSKNYRVTETATSSEGGWISSYSPNEQPANQPVQLFSHTVPEAQENVTMAADQSPWLAIPSKGVAITLASPTIVAHDGVCTFNQYAIG